MEHIPDPSDLTLRVCEALANGDAAFFEHLNGSQAVMLGIGAVPQRWWPDYAKLIEAFLRYPRAAQPSDTGATRRRACNAPSAARAPTA